MSSRRTALGLLLTLALLVGGLLRLSHLPAKVFGGDEVFSALRIAGSSFLRAEAQLADGRPHPVADWQAHLAPIPGSRASDTVRALAQEAPEHPPLFFLAARLWQQRFGASDGSRRLLPALFSLALMPAMAALAWELWHCRRTCLLTTALVALSPFHVLYAKELRQYSLWASLIALTAWLLLRALQHNRGRDWLAYGAAATGLLYCHLFSLGLVLAFAALPLLPAWRRRWRSLLLSTGAALLAFSPWLEAAAQGAMLRRGSNLWTAADLPLPLLSWNWGLNLSRVWIDLDPGGRLIGGDSPATALARLLIVLASALAVILAFAVPLRAADRRPIALLLALLAGSVLPLMAADLVLGGSRSAIARYPVAGYLAVQLALASALGQLWLRQRTLSIALAALVLILSLQSSLRALAAPTWWSKQGSIDQGSIAEAINDFQTPLVVAEGYLPRLLSLSAALHPDAELLVLQPGQPWPAAANPARRPVLLYRPSAGLLDKLAPMETRDLIHTPSRYPYLPAVDAHTRLWLVQLHPEGIQP